MITFYMFLWQNTYNRLTSLTKANGMSWDIKPAVAISVYGDKSAFYNCDFLGLQDTVWDNLGRHHFKNCYIEGAIDFIFGSGQSVYEVCILNISLYYVHFDFQWQNTKTVLDHYLHKDCYIHSTNTLL